MPSVPAEIGWEESTYCYLDPDWGPKSQWIINKAMKQINNNLDIVEDFFDRFRPSIGGRLDGSCVTDLITATNWAAGFLHFEKADDTRGCGFSGPGWNGCTVPGAVVIQLAYQYVAGCYNTYKSYTCGSGDGRCACTVAILASTILHETCHSCVLGETVAAMMATHYKYEFSQAHGYTSSRCCSDGLSSYYESENTSSSASAEGEVVSYYEGEDGEYYLESC